MSVRILSRFAFHRRLVDGRRVMMTPVASAVAVLVGATAALGACRDHTPPGPPHVAAPHTPTTSGKEADDDQRAGVGAPVEPTPRTGTLDAGVDGPATYARILAAIVTDDGLVRYRRLDDATRRSALESVVDWYARTRTPTDRAARMAFWCNAYNANVLLSALRERGKAGFESVLKVPGFFDQRPIRVGGETMTINDLENERIRPLGDTRIHAVLVCAALSCPPLRNEPFSAASLDAQLDDQCRRWVNDGTRFRVVDGKLGLSEILKWYAADFEKPPYASAIGFVLAYADDSSAIARHITGSGSPQVAWIPYDWSLNEAR